MYVYISKKFTSFLIFPLPFWRTSLMLSLVLLPSFEAIPITETISAAASNGSEAAAPLALKDCCVGYSQYFQQSTSSSQFYYTMNLPLMYVEQFACAFYHQEITPRAANPILASRTPRDLPNAPWRLHAYFFGRRWYKKIGKKKKNGTEKCKNWR